MLMLVNGDYVPQENGLQSAKGDEAVLQRMLMKLTARRGQFPFMENFGSRLWTLDRLRPAERQAAAEQYVLEALRDDGRAGDAGGERRKGVPDGERRQRRMPIDGGGGLGAGGSDNVRATETIYREMLTAYAKRRGGQLQEDCDLSVRLWAAAAQIQALEAQAEWVLGQSFPQTAAGVYLDRHGAMRGIVRQASSRATGQLTFRLSNAQTGAVSVETGTVCMTEGTVRFRTTEPGTIPAGEAVEAGSSGNVGAGTVHVLTACPVAVTAVTNEEAFTGGLSEETDEELRQRILDSFQRLPNGANAAWYELTACRHEGVAAAKAVGKARWMCMYRHRMVFPRRSC